MRCTKCNEFHKWDEKHDCKKDDMQLDIIKPLLLTIKGLNKRILVALNGLRAQSEDVFLVIKSDFELNHGLHSIDTLENNFIRIDEQIALWPEFPVVIPMDQIRIEWRLDLLSLEIPSNGLTLFFELLKLYKVDRNITLNINDEFTEYQGKHFDIIIRTEEET